MKSGCELGPHMHEHGWLSGAVHINVPEKKDKRRKFCRLR